MSPKKSGVVIIVSDIAWDSGEAYGYTVSFPSAVSYSAGIAIFPEERKTRNILSVPGTWERAMSMRSGLAIITAL